MEEWGPIEWCVLAKHFERQGKSPYAYHAVRCSYFCYNICVKFYFIAVCKVVVSFECFVLRSTCLFRTRNSLVNLFVNIWSYDGSLK